MTSARRTKTIVWSTSLKIGSTVECIKEGGRTSTTLKTNNRNLGKTSELMLATRNGPDVVVDQSSPQNNQSPQSIGKHAGTLIAEIQVSGVVLGQRTTLKTEWHIHVYSRMMGWWCLSVPKPALYRHRLISINILSTLTNQVLGQARNGNRMVKKPFKFTYFLMGMKCQER